MGTTTTKSLNTALPSEESKTPEIDSKSQKKASKSLSSRASAVKKSLRSKQEVDAIILKPDGSAEQIKYNTSSKQANKLLNGRPTIIGELEGIQTVIARSLNQ